MPVERRKGKVTQRYVQVLSEKTDSIANVLNWNPQFEDARRYWTDVMQENFWMIVTAEHVAEWGKPNIQMNSYESAPGVWVFDDTDSGAVWVLWTDLHHKNPWKGTSFEIYVPETTTGIQMVDILKRFIGFLKIS